MPETSQLVIGEPQRAARRSRCSSISIPAWAAPASRRATRPSRWWSRSQFHQARIRRPAVLRGQVQHLELPNERRDAVALRDEEAGRTARCAGGGGLAPHILIRRRNGHVRHRSGCAHADRAAGRLLRFHGSQYNDVWKKPGDRLPFETSLFVQTTVISANRAGLATTDAGFKAFATDARPAADRPGRAGRRELFLLRR